MESEITIFYRPIFNTENIGDNTVCIIRVFLDCIIEYVSAQSIYGIPSVSFEDCAPYQDSHDCGHY
jgi:hypothetical protein